MSMGRRQKGIRILWSILWERDHWHHVIRGMKKKANRAWRHKLKAEVQKEIAHDPT